MYTVHYTFLDNNNNKGECRVHLPPNFSMAQAQTWAIASAGVFEGVSDAYLQSITLRINPAFNRQRNQPLPTANVFNNLLLFFRNDNNFGFIRLPSAAANLPYDTTGIYRGHRITNNSLSNSPIAGLLTPVVQRLVQPWGGVFPQTFWVGTRTRET